MRAITVALCSTLVASASLSSSAQPSTSPSYMDPGYRPTIAATSEDVVGHYTRSGDPQVDVWFGADGTARIRFVDSPGPEDRFGSTHEYQATWQIRNGWVDLTSDSGHVVLEFEPGTSPSQHSTLTAKHALRSSLLVRFQTLSKVPAS